MQHGVWYASRSFQLDFTGIIFGNITRSRPGSGHLHPPPLALDTFRSFFSRHLHGVRSDPPWPFRKQPGATKRGDISGIGVSNAHRPIARGEKPASEVGSSIGCSGFLILAIRVLILALHRLIASALRLGSGGFGYPVEIISNHLKAASLPLQLSLGASHSTVGQFRLVHFASHEVMARMLASMEIYRRVQSGLTLVFGKAGDDSRQCELDMSADRGELGRPVPFGVREPDPRAGYL